MSYGPFFDNIASTVTAAPGTGNIVVTGAAPNALSWTTIGSVLICHYRAEEGATWEIGIGKWAQSTSQLLRLAVIASSSGTSKISFGTGVIIGLIAPADEVQPHIGGPKWGMWTARPGQTTMDTFGLAAPTDTGTATSPALTATRIGKRHRIILTSLTTASAIAGLSSTANIVTTTASQTSGGFEFVARGGFSTLPTGPRIAVGVSAGVLSTVEPSTLNNSAFFAKDSTDTNFQFMSRNGATTTKVDTGIAPTLNVPYEFSVWATPETAAVWGALTAMDGSASWYGSIATNLPTADTAMNPIFQASLNGTNTGTAIAPNIESVFLRSTQ
jgi:hypothetical protein